MDNALPRQVNTVIVGNGPSALILSYILHGHIPVYDSTTPHPDKLLHEKLKPFESLLDVDVDRLTEHFYASRFSYSTQALPINVLLDTLIRPYGESDDADNSTCIKWHHDPARAVPHVVVGNTTRTGGLWVENSANAHWDLGTLSYGRMLSLPGYSFADFYLERHGESLPCYLRPSRREITQYFAHYPVRVGISDSLYFNQTLGGIQRTRSGFYIKSHDLHCAHLVLASGTFTSFILPGPILQPLLTLPHSETGTSSSPILVIGSGFSAADIIISAPRSQKIIHIFKWAPSTSPSPLKSCHQTAYPEYASIYRRMKLAAISSSCTTNNNNTNKSAEPTNPTDRVFLRRMSSNTIDSSRDWADTYEGLPNTTILKVEINPDKTSATVTFQNKQRDTFQHSVSGLSYMIGRRGSLAYLDKDLQSEICPDVPDVEHVSGSNMREKALDDLEVAKDVFITGSLTGDTLIRFAYGGCAYVAGKIMARQNRGVANGIGNARSQVSQSIDDNDCNGAVKNAVGETEGGACHGCGHGIGNGNGVRNKEGARYIKAMYGLEGHSTPTNASP